MKKILLLLSPILFLSCTTLKDPSKENVGLLLMPHTIEKTSNDSFFGNFCYVIEADHHDFKKEYKIPTTNGTRRIYLKPGSYTITGIAYTYNRSEVGGGEIQDQDYTFTVLHGEISVLPITFTTTMREKRMSWKYDSTTSLEYKDAIDSVNGFESFELWRVK